MPRWLVYLPALVIGATAAAYWYRVLRMAAKARRRTGRGANFLPPERLGRLLRVAWVPAVGIWIVGPFAAALWASAPPAVRPLWWSPVVAWCMAGGAVGCFVATRICWRRMGGAWRMGIDPAERTPLVATGPYAYVRHPIYALSAALMAATVVAVPSPLLIAAGVTHVALLVWESRREERYLLRVHGDGYGHYRSRVGAFFPRSASPYAAPAGGVG